MKYFVFFIIFFSTTLTTNAQEIGFLIRGKYARPITLTQLEKANFLTDFIDGYPTNWIDEYLSVDVSAVNAGLTQIEIGENTVLKANQKAVLVNADMLSDIVIHVSYIAKNTLTLENQNKHITVRMTVIPEIQAQFDGGKDKQSDYFKEKLFAKIPHTISDEFKKGIVNFTINENGDVVKSEIKTSSGDGQVDKLLIEAINKMPKWKPAENLKGQKFKQDFEFSFGNNSGC